MRRRSGISKPSAAGAVAVAAAAAGGVVLARRRRAAAPSPAGLTPIVDPEQPYTCSCGATYGTTGAGRHRVFWPIDGDPADAVLEDHCPACGRPWPAEATATVA